MRRIFFGLGLRTKFGTAKSTQLTIENVLSRSRIGDRCHEMIGLPIQKNITTQFEN